MNNYRTYNDTHSELPPFWEILSIPATMESYSLCFKRARSTWHRFSKVSLRGGTTIDGKTKLHPDVHWSNEVPSAIQFIFSSMTSLLIEILCSRECTNAFIKPYKNTCRLRIPIIIVIINTLMVFPVSFNEFKRYRLILRDQSSHLHQVVRLFCRMLCDIVFTAVNRCTKFFNKLRVQQQTCARGWIRIITHICFGAASQHYGEYVWFCWHLQSRTVCTATTNINRNKGMISLNSMKINLLFLASCPSSFT